MKLTDEQVKDIAGNLDMGLICYVHSKTKEIKKVPDEMNMAFADLEFWQDDIDEVENNSSDYIEIQGMQSYESFEIMKDFAEKVEDTNFKAQLIDALEKRKPFQNFKWLVEGSENFRQPWFDYKEQRLINWVENQLKKSVRKRHTF